MIVPSGVPLFKLTIYARQFGPTEIKNVEHNKRYERFDEKVSGIVLCSARTILACGFPSGDAIRSVDSGFEKNIALCVGEYKDPKSPVTFLPRMLTTFPALMKQGLDLALTSIDSSEIYCN